MSDAARDRTFWLALAMFISGYAVGAVREHWLDERDLNYALRQSSSCAQNLDRAVATLETVEPILRSVWPKESKWWFADEDAR